MQSFIVNVPDEKVNFFLELIEMLDFEVLEIDEDQFEVEEEDDEQEATQASTSKKSSSRLKEKAAEEEEVDDPFLDWDAERKNAKKNKY